SRIIQQPRYTADHSRCYAQLNNGRRRGIRVSLLCAAVDCQDRPSLVFSTSEFPGTKLPESSMRSEHVFSDGYRDSRSESDGMADIAGPVIPVVAVISSRV